MICGLPFSGKTTLAEAFARSGAVVISRDAFLEAVHADKAFMSRVKFDSVVEDSLSFNEALTRQYVAWVAKEVLRLHAPLTVVDGLHLTPMSRAFVRELSTWHATAVWITPDAERSLRLRTTAMPQGIRARVDDAGMRKLANEVVEPGRDEGFEEILTLEWPFDAETVVRKLGF